MPPSLRSEIVVNWTMEFHLAPPLWLVYSKDRQLIADMTNLNMVCFECGCKCSREPWLMVFFTPTKYSTCFTQLSEFSGLAYPDLHDYPWSTSWPHGCVILNLNPKTRMIAEHIWCDVWCETVTHSSLFTTQLSGMVHVLPNMPATIGWHIQTFNI